MKIYKPSYAHKGGIALIKSENFLRIVAKLSPMTGKIVL